MSWLSGKGAPSWLESGFPSIVEAAIPRMGWLSSQEREQPRPFVAHLQQALVDIATSAPGIPVARRSALRSHTDRWPRRRSDYRPERQILYRTQLRYSSR